MYGGGYLLGLRFQNLMIPEIAGLFGRNIIVGFAGYFLLGYYLSITDIKKWRYIIYASGIVGIIEIILGSILLSIHDGKTNFLFIDYLSIPVATTASALYLFIKYNSENVAKFISIFIEATRKCLFGIYLVHPLWLAVFNTSSFRNLTTQYLSLPIISVVVFTLSLLLSKLILSVPLLKKTIE